MYSGEGTPHKHAMLELLAATQRQLAADHFTVLVVCILALCALFAPRLFYYGIRARLFMLAALYSLLTWLRWCWTVLHRARGAALQ